MGLPLTSVSKMDIFWQESRDLREQISAQIRWHFHSRFSDQNWTFWVSKCKDCIMCFYYLVTVKNLVRKPGLVFTFERTKCQLLPSPCLGLSSVKHLFETFLTLVTVIFSFLSSLWKLLIKNSLKGKLLSLSRYLFYFFAPFEGCRCMKEGVGEGWRSQIFFWWWTEVL